MEIALQKVVWETVKMLGVYVLIMSPLAIWLWRLHAERRKHLDGREEPFTQYPIRPPGESLRLKIAELESQCDERLTTFLLIPTVLAGMIVANPAFRSFPYLAGALVIILSYSLRAGPRLLRFARELRDYKLGYLGERVVGEQLNQLMLEGFRVFHDVPFDGYNIDHVIVGARGVFAVETKTRRKPRGDDGTKNYRVTYDGAVLRWPWGEDAHGLEQACDNARALAVFLSSATGEQVKVDPMLVLPGWWVERIGRGPVNVLNEKEIRRSFRNHGKLMEPQINRIVHQLTDKCRVVREPVGAAPNSRSKR